MCIYINNRWCSNVKIHTTLCSPNLELLTLFVRPFYLPREFSNNVLNCVYVPPSADALAAADTIVMGDFNSCTLDTALPSFHQYLHVPTRNNKTIDLCYGNIPSAYSARAHPPLDHNVISLIPELLKRVKPTKVNVRQWTQDATMQLQGFMACTDWGVLAPDSVNLNEHAFIITDYITFCMDSTIPMKTVTVYPNSNPWITSDIKKNTLKKKQIAYRTMKNAHRQLQTEISQAKQRYREKVDNLFSCMNTK